MSQSSYDRPARKVRAVSVQDPSDVVEYPSISAAAKGLEGQVSQRNVRALLTRTIMKNETLLGRKWEIQVDDESQPKQATFLEAVPQVPPPMKTTANAHIEELALKRQQMALKEKQIDLLIRYMDTLKDKNDPFVQMLMKQFLAL